MGMPGVGKAKIAVPPRMPKEGFLVISPSMTGSNPAFEFFETLEQAKLQAEKFAADGPDNQKAYIVKVADVITHQR